jgi:centromere protein I
MAWKISKMVRRGLRAQENKSADIETTCEASATPSKNRKSSISGPVDVICDSAFDLGLSLDSLTAIVHIITQPNELDQSTIGTIIKYLYPATKVTEDVAIRIVGCLGQGERKPPLPIQAGLLKWLIMVYDVLEGQAVLSSLYGVLFNMLDMLSLRLVSLGL